MQQDYKDEYENLAPEEREEIVNEFVAQRSSEPKLRRPNARGRMADVANIVRNMQLLVCCPRLWNFHFNYQIIQIYSLQA